MVFVLFISSGVPKLGSSHGTLTSIIELQDVLNSNEEDEVISKDDIIDDELPDDNSADEEEEHEEVESQVEVIEQEEAANQEAIPTMNSTPEDKVLPSSYDNQEPASAAHDEMGHKQGSSKATRQQDHNSPNKRPAGSTSTCTLL